MTLRRVVIALCSFQLCGWAQTSSARITGIVTDPAGAVIPAAHITATNRDTGVVTPTESNDRGIYTVSFLPPGPYDLQVEAPGFKRYDRTHLKMETGAALSLDVRLEIGDTSDSVTVSAATPLLQSETSSYDTFIENATVSNMPLESRRAGGLLRLLGNVAFVSEETWEGIANFSIAGGRARQQIWQLDGGNLQGVMMTTGIVQVLPPVEAMEEFRVETNAYPAEFGRTMGGFISMTTKSGTNQDHGSLYEFLRTDTLDARNFFSPTKAPLHYNVFGATVGGPIRKNKTFFFFSYEGTRRRDGATRVLSVPTRQEETGNFSADVGNITDPLSKQPFPGKVIPQSRLDPVGYALAQLWPAPNVPNTPSGKNNFVQNAVSTTDADSYIAKVDHVFSDHDRLSVRYLKFRSPIEGGRVFPNPAADSAVDQLSDQFHITGTWLHNINATKFNELRYTFNDRTNLAPSLYPSTIARDVGLTGVALDGTPTVTVTGFSQIGVSGQYRDAGPGVQNQVIDSLSWFKGKHQLKIGGEWRRAQMPDTWGDYRSGLFDFNNVATGNGLASLLLGWTDSVQVTSGATKTRMTYYAGYIQDDWRVTSNLTLNAGLRWEMDTPRSEANNEQTGFDTTKINPVSGTPGIITYAGVNGVSVYANRFDTNNLGPRFGFAWRPEHGNFVVRGGYGLIYGPLYDDSITRANVTGYGQTWQYQSPDNGLTPALLLKNGVPTPPVEPIGPGFGAVKVGQPPTTSPDFYLQDQKNTYSNQYNIVLQRQLRGSLLLEASYTANLAHDVGARDTNINEIPPQLRGAVQSQILRPFPQYSNVIVRGPNWGNSSYHGLNIKAEKRFSHGLNLLSNYTWSKFLDDVEAASEVGGASGSGQESYYARHLDKSYSGNDIRNRWVSSAVYDLPGHFSNHVARSVLNGWSLGLIGEMRSGLPYGVVEQTNRLDSFSASQRPNLVGNPALPTDRPRAEQVAEWFNVKAFTAPGNGVLGTAARNQGFGPGSINLDTSLMKNFPFAEKRFVQFRGEIYNVANRPNFGQPGLLQGSVNFGTITTAADGRTIQLALKVVF